MLRDNLGKNQMKDATATSQDIFKGKIAYGKEGKIYGNMPYNNAVNVPLNLNNLSYNIPRGSHLGTDNIYISVQNFNIEPKRATQIITPSNNKVISSIFLSGVNKNTGAGKECYDMGYNENEILGYNRGIEECKKGNAEKWQVLSGKTFTNSSSINEKGSMLNRGTINVNLDTSTTNFTIPQGYHDGNGNIKIITQSINIEPKGNSQIIKPDNGKIISSVILNDVNKNAGIGKTIYDNGYSEGDYAGYSSGRASVMIGNALAEQVLEGYTFTNISSININGKMPNKSNWTGYTSEKNKLYIPKGYHNGNGWINVDNSYSDGRQNGINEVEKGNAIPNDVLNDFTFSNSQGINLQGSMINRGTVNLSAEGHITEKQFITIPEGYHNGQGKITIPKFDILLQYGSNNWKYKEEPVETKNGRDLVSGTLITPPNGDPYYDTNFTILENGIYQTHNLIKGHVYILFSYEYKRWYTEEPDLEGGTYSMMHTGYITYTGDYTTYIPISDYGGMEILPISKGNLIFKMNSDVQPSFLLAIRGTRTESRDVWIEELGTTLTITDEVPSVATRTIVIYELHG